jgi:hypothetical protein
MNTMTPQTWEDIVAGLDTATLVSLIRGLLLAEEAHEWRGSTSGVICVSERSNAATIERLKTGHVR